MPGPAGVEEQGQGTRGAPGNLGDPAVSTDTSGPGTGSPTPRPPAVRPGRRERTAARRWYRRAKATKHGERDGGESERPIRPRMPGNQPEGPGGGKGAPCHETAGGKHGGCIGLDFVRHAAEERPWTRASRSGSGNWSTSTSSPDGPII